MFQRRLLTLSGLVLLTTLAIVLPLVVIITLIMSLMRNFAHSAGPNLYLRISGHEWAGLARFLFVLIRYRNTNTWTKIEIFNFGGPKVCSTWVNAYTNFELKSLALKHSRATCLAAVPTLQYAIQFYRCCFSANSGAKACAMCSSKNWLSTLSGHWRSSPVNVFVDRSGTDSAKAVKEVSQLIATAGEDESVLIYPEGARFTQKTRQFAQRHPKLKDQLTVGHLLPPRLGGVLGMLEANPGKIWFFLRMPGLKDPRTFMTCSAAVG